MKNEKKALAFDALSEWCNGRVMKSKKSFAALYEWCNSTSDFDHFYDGLTRILNEGDAKRLFAERCSDIGYPKGMRGQAQEFWDRFRISKEKSKILKERKIK